MTITKTITTWLGAWKYVLILAALLALSLWGNLHQYVASKTAPLREDLKQATQALDTVNRVAKQAQADQTDTLNRLNKIAERGERTHVVYRTAATDQPLPPQCAPGQARVDAINAGLGPQK
jgi:hypothetical protein